MPKQYLGTEGEDPTAPIWGSGNYVGPYWSDGKKQSSVEWGESEPINDLDAAARRHDSAYAHYKDERHRAAADALFAEEVRKIDKKYGSKLAEDPQFAANAVEYGNFTVRKFKELANSGMWATVPGVGQVYALLKHGYKTFRDQNQMVHGTYLKKEKEAIREYFKSDPKKVARVAAEALALGQGAKDVAEVAALARRQPSKTQVSPSDSTQYRYGQNLVDSQRYRILNHRRLHKESNDSIGQPRVYHKRKLNLNKAKPKKTHKNQVRPL